MRTVSAIVPTQTAVDGFVQTRRREWSVAGLPLASSAAAASPVFLSDRTEPGNCATARRAERQADDARHARAAGAACLKRWSARRAQVLAARALRPLVAGQSGQRSTSTIMLRSSANFYSVPFTLVRKRVDVFITGSGVQIFHRGERAASHVRQTGQNQWTTLGEHMPPAHSAMAKPDAGLGSRPSGQGRLGHSCPMSSGC